MAQANKYSTKTDGTKNAFEITFTRETHKEIAKLIIAHGGVIVWVIIGSTLLLLVIIMICLWKKCTAGKKDEAAGSTMFYQEDCYARV